MQGRGARYSRKAGSRPTLQRKGATLTGHGGYDVQHVERLRKIHDRLSEARRELDALIGDAYLRPRASIVPVHFLDLAAAVEKLRWAEKEWRELDNEVEAASEAAAAPDEEGGGEDDLESEEPAQRAILQPTR